MKSYKDLEVCSLGLELFYKCHSYSLKLPKNEMYELEVNWEDFRILFQLILLKDMEEKNIKLIL